MKRILLTSLALCSVVSLASCKIGKADTVKATTMLNYSVLNASASMQCENKFKASEEMLSSSVLFETSLNKLQKDAIEETLPFNHALFLYNSAENITIPQNIKTTIEANEEFKKAVSHDSNNPADLTNSKYQKYAFKGVDIEGLEVYYAYYFEDLTPGSDKKSAFKDYTNELPFHVKGALISYTKTVSDSYSASSMIKFELNNGSGLGANFKGKASRSFPDLDVTLTTTLETSDKEFIFTNSLQNSRHSEPQTQILRHRKKSNKYELWSEYYYQPSQSSSNKQKFIYNVVTDGEISKTSNKYIIKYLNSGVSEDNTITAKVSLSLLQDGLKFDWS